MPPAPSPPTTGAGQCCCARRLPSYDPGLVGSLATVSALLSPSASKVLTDQVVQTSAPCMLLSR
ncbi:hypothetical protein PsYK624_008090 [Phanerochaete sordida]|uniref:Uncharacterized protein n=1 Tax=Phanerochaete sordida TaxID=48140 RepID=A0A9P3L887_9APHY|nr:hypothetical protein PsYK624_008090 [Phanerochaete sordida]